MYKDVIEMDLTPDSIQELTILLDKIIDTPEKDSEDFKKLCRTKWRTKCGTKCRTKCRTKWRTKCRTK